jgi:hypothetical protein
MGILLSQLVCECEKKGYKRDYLEAYILERHLIVLLLSDSIAANNSTSYSRHDYGRILRIEDVLCVVVLVVHAKLYSTNPQVLSPMNRSIAIPVQ